MKFYPIVFLGTMLFLFGSCKKAGSAPIELSGIPKEVHGLYCHKKDGDNCDLGVGIGADEAYDQSIGGCFKVSKITRQGNELTLLCSSDEGGSEVKIIVLSPAKLEFIVDGETYVLIKRKIQTISANTTGRWVESPGSVLHQGDCNDAVIKSAQKQLSQLINENSMLALGPSDIICPADKLTTKAKCDPLESTETLLIYCLN